MYANCLICVVCIGPPAKCAPECENGGTCTSPNRCQCASGWSGSRCQTGKTDSNLVI